LPTEPEGLIPRLIAKAIVDVFEMVIIEKRQNEIRRLLRQEREAFLLVLKTSAVG
jgi:hypothetical protein